MKLIRTMAALCVVGAVLAWGCDTHKHEHGSEKKQDHDDHDHDHDKPGPNGGALEDFGKYHVEVVYDRDKKEVTVYVLDDKMKNPQSIKSEKLVLRHENPQMQVELKAMPQASEKDGMSSRFVGKEEKLGDKGPVPPYEVTGEMGGKQYAAKYKKK